MHDPGRFSLTKIYVEKTKGYKCTPGKRVSHFKNGVKTKQLVLYGPMNEGNEKVVNIQELFHKYCPDLIKRMIDPLTPQIDQFIISSVSELGPDKLVLDAGAGESRFKALLKDVLAKKW